ncbi:hypothetical protein EYF80_010467 [Liparis tanakae]|uniref:Uncharacterized protein n=1 Tax=Liparis tanakae TaxID=230148 RepID=A0A4Z2IPX2_9TELE|nr:hypothetical protein EYF80_010467 [Liparis tanakae]
MEDEKELAYRGEGTTSLTVSSEDFCSREISELYSSYIPTHAYTPRLALREQEVVQRITTSCVGSSDTDIFWTSRVMNLLTCNQLANWQIRLMLLIQLFISSSVLATRLGFLGLHRNQ